MLIQLKVAHHQEGVLQRGLWCEATLTAEDPKRLFQYPDPEISRVWLFFKPNIANPSYYLKQLKVELLHYLFEFTRKLAHLSQSSGDEVGLFFPNPGRETMCPGFNFISLMTNDRKTMPLFMCLWPFEYLPCGWGSI